MKNSTYIGRTRDAETKEKLVDVVGVSIYRYPENFQTYQTKRGPRESNRVFPTLAHAQAYIDDLLNTDGTIHKEGDGKKPVESAFPGIILTVVNDPDTKNNGAYLVINIDIDPEDPEDNTGLGLKRLDVNPITEQQINALFDEQW